MKLFFAVIMLIACTGVGYILTLKFISRRKFYSEFLNFNKKIKNEVQFSSSTIKKIINENNDITDFNIAIKDGLTCKTNKINYNYLTKEEKEYFDKYVNEVGKSDKISQLEFLTSASKYIEEKVNLTNTEEVKYKKLYIKLGFLFGLIIFIIII